MIPLVLEIVSSDYNYWYRFFPSKRTITSVCFCSDIRSSL